MAYFGVTDGDCTTDFQGGPNPSCCSSNVLCPRCARAVLCGRDLPTRNYSGEHSRGLQALTANHLSPEEEAHIIAAMEPPVLNYAQEAARITGNEAEEQEFDPETGKIDW